jgi:chitin disaccharide deacetylase
MDPMDERRHAGAVECTDEAPAARAMDEAALLAVLARLPSGITEIYLHPATVSGGAIAASMNGYRHADEFAALLSPRVRAAVAAAGIERGGYADALLARG